MASETKVSALIAVGGSTGSVEALIQLTQLLPSDFSAAICVVVHIQANHSIALPRTLRRRAALPVLEAVDSTPIQPGHVYIAPPDRHLIVSPGLVRLSMGAKEHQFRPAIDPLFRTAAHSYKHRTVGVILSGALWDGTAGLAEIKSQSGVTIAQDPEQALVPSMPQSAIHYGVVDHILPTAEIAPLLVALVQQLE